MMNFERMSADTCRTEYPKLFEVYENLFPEMSDVAIALMVSVAVDVCPYCWKHLKPCHCWNDD